MKLTKKDLPKKQLELTFELTPEELQPYLTKATEEISQTKKIAGFRPGKAPYNLVVQAVGEMTIYQTAANLAVAETYYDAIEKENLETIDQPTIEILKLAPNNPFIYKATVSLLPKATPCDYYKIKIDKLPEIKVGEKELEKTLEDLKKLRAKETLADKPAEKGDKVEMDFDAFMDNVPLEGGSAKKHRLAIGEGQMIPGFEDNLIGLKANETKEFELSFPEKYHQKNLAGKKATFKIKLLGVFKVEFPEINDEFAKGVWLKDLENLRKNIETNIKRERELAAIQKQELEIIEKLLEKSKFEELPDAMVNQETHKMVHELEENVARQGHNFADYLNHMKKTEADLKLDFVPEAIKRVQTALLMRVIADQEKIEVSDEEIKTEIEKTLASYKLNPADNTDVAELEKNLRSENAQHYFRNFLTNRKTMARLKEIIIKK